MLEHPMERRLATALMALVVGTLCLIGCSSNHQPPATLKATLEVRQMAGGLVAFQNGQPVPDFGVQQRPRLALDGSWRFQAAQLDDRLSFNDRRQTLGGLTAEAGPRLQDTYDDSGWQLSSVPGTFNQPPAGHATGGWYRTQFSMPTAWPERTSLRFGSVNYLADVWLNGRHLGYHEGGTTPFALDPADALRRVGLNTLVVRVSRPLLGARLDLVPWGLTDWWDYGGVTGPVWLEGEPELQAVRADVVPHLDGADVFVVAQNHGTESLDGVSIEVDVLPAAVDESNVLNPDPKSLVVKGAQPVLSRTVDMGSLPAGSVRRVDAPFAIRSPFLWSPSRPALYVLHVFLLTQEVIKDELYGTFGLRQIKVDPTAPRLLLNGIPVAFHGVATHDERQTPSVGGRPAGGPITEARQIMDKLTQARGVNADLIRDGHTPPNPWLPLLADRLGFAVWEEIPLYHFTPATFNVATDRGVPQQMLAEMVLRDFSRPSVLFHGFANESEGGAERVSALTALRDLDRRLDGTRLTGQASYGSDPTDSSSAPLDVAGFTLYYGVFYGGELDATTIRRALDRTHQAYPKKPVMILEFGRWADSQAEEAEQQRVFTVTYSAIEPVQDLQPDGYVGAAVWWSLDDYWTQRPGLEIEHFGLYRPDGSARPVQAAAASAFAATATSGSAGRGAQEGIVSGGQGIPLGQNGASTRLIGLIAYALGLPLVLVAGLLLLLTIRRRPPRTA
jgi:beta-galactosidase